MTRLLTSLAAALALTAGPVLAQSRALGSLTVEVRGGYVMASRDLGRTEVLDGAGYVTFDRLDPTPTFAAGIEMPLSERLAVRVTADYAFETDAKGLWLCDAFSPCPSVLILVNGRVRRRSALADLRLRSNRAVGPLRPLVFLGAGRREYRLRWNSPVPEVPIPTSYDRATWFARTGVGAELSRGSWVLLAEVDAAIGGFGVDAPTFFEGTVPADSKGAAAAQVDIGLSVGVRFGLR